MHRAKLADFLTGKGHIRRLSRRANDIRKVSAHDKKTKKSDKTKA